MSRIVEKATHKETCLARDEILSRRGALLDMLIAGSCLFAPVALLGACSKEAESDIPKLLQKLSKAEVKYQDQPKGAQQCSNCSKFNSAKKTCQRVEGQVSPEGWCVLWARNA